VSRLRAILGPALALAVSVSARAAEPCHIVDATTHLAAVAAATTGASEAEQLAAYRAALIEPHPGLYSTDVLTLAGPALERQILRSLAQARKSGELSDFKETLRQEIGASAAAFAVFADFRCDFPIYFADTLGEMDGAGRIVDGQRSLVLGVSVVQHEAGKIALPVLLRHEFFHRYHYRAGGFSDDLEERQEIWRNLWAEGLATYASEVLTPGATRAQALMLPADLERRCRPQLLRRAQQLLRGLDTKDPDMFRSYFSYNQEKDGIPTRAGYYVGYVVAQRLAAHHTLAQLAHLRGAAAHRAIVAELTQLAHASAAP
jgi:Predicted Zn-dependent protease (DUF2268)